MATAPQIQTAGTHPSANHCSRWLDSTAKPADEARGLFAMIGKNGDTVESIRELIRVPPEINHVLNLYLRRHPEDADGLMRVLEFRKCVAKEFEQLTIAQKGVT